ncbi:MAG: BamA/TamA family outer membrane protein [Bacteroidota bacterium]|jgi:outer membrane protein assembly factor BamA
MKNVFSYSFIIIVQLTCPFLIAQTDTSRSQWEALPILSYDTDAGFGYGAKTMLVNFLGQNESFDIILFNSTKGERWYRFVASYPDFEWRQGTIYPISIDVTIDYDKWISNSFFGIGNNSQFSNREIYTREPLDCSMMFGRGITSLFVVQIGIRYRSIHNFHFLKNSVLLYLSPAVNSSTATMHSMLINARYDSRNSFITPSSGLVLSGEGEYAPIILGSNTRFSKFSARVQYYEKVAGSSVAAGRIIVQSLFGNNLPVQSLISVGGTNTLRGIPQDRFLDRSAIVANLEYRMPVIWRFGGVIGVDAGRVWNSLSTISSANWSVNYVGGIRLYMDTFVVRLDIGISKETSGFYLNFGELF